MTHTDALTAYVTACTAQDLPGMAAALHRMWKLDTRNPGTDDEVHAHILHSLDDGRAALDVCREVTRAATGEDSLDTWTTAAHLDALDHFAQGETPDTRTYTQDSTGAYVQWIWHSAQGRRYVSGFMADAAENGVTFPNLDALLSAAHDALTDAVYATTWTALHTAADLDTPDA